MKKRALTAVFLALMCIASMYIPVFAATEKKTNHAAKARNGVVRILGISENGSAWTGTGFGVGEAGEPTSVFITNHHVSASNDFSGAEYLYILLDDDWYSFDENGGLVINEEHAVRCNVVYEPDTYPDYAILQAERVITERVALPLMPAALAEPGETIYALGYPGASDEVTESITASIDSMTVTKGTISRLTNLAQVDTDVIQIDAQINHGNSGGPLITEEGYVIGLNTYGLEENIYLAVQIDYVIERLNNLCDIGTLHDFSFTVIEEESDDSAKLDPNFPIIIGCTASVIVVAAIIVIFVLVVKKKRKITSQVSEAVILESCSSAVPENSFSETVATDEGIGKTVFAYDLEEYRLVGVSGAFEGRRIAITKAMRIGRDPEKNDLVFDSSTAGVSGVHCIITPVPDGVILKDLGSTYGTFLSDGTKLEPNRETKLNIGDSFYLATTGQSFRIDRKSEK